jgi:hypothetical protein
MLRNKIISIVALATIGPASPTGHSLAVGAAVASRSVTDSFTKDPLEGRRAFDL